MIPEGNVLPKMRLPFLLVNLIEFISSAGACSTVKWNFEFYIIMGTFMLPDVSAPGALHLVLHVSKGASPLVREYDHDTGVQPIT